YADRPRRDPARGRPLDREPQRRERRDTRHAARSPARAHRPPARGEPPYLARRIRDRSAVRTDDPRETAGGSTEMTTKTELVTLERSGLIQVAAVQPELEYLFRHALVQDAAYSSLLKQDRRSLHKLAAETLLSLYPERRRELAAVIAMHFEQAGDRGNAAEHLIVAGEHALERFAQREAVSFFARSAELLPVDDPRVDLRMRAAIGSAKAGWTFAGLSGATEQLERAVAIAGDRADRKLLGEACFWVVVLRRMSGESPASSPQLKQAVEQAEAIGEELGDPSAHAIPKAFMGVGVMFNGELRQGAQLLSEALDELEGRADPLTTAVLSGFLAITYARLG